jgi:hypothetical protein
VGLLKIQQELAAILLEPAARKAFAEEPRGYLRKRGVKGRDVELLASLVPDDLAYFAERRNIDRHHALRADAPRSVRLLESAHGRPNSYFRAFPYSLEDPRDETDRFARWCKAAAHDGILPAVLPDVAAFEAAGLRMIAQPFRPAKPSAKPKRAPGVKVLRLRHRIGPVLRTGNAAAANPGPTVMALVRSADDVHWFVLPPLQAMLLLSADGRRTPATWLKAAAVATSATVAQARKAAAALARDGLLAPAPGRRHG